MGRWSATGSTTTVILGKHCNDFSSANVTIDLSVFGSITQRLLNLSNDAVNGYAVLICSCQSQNILSNIILVTPSLALCPHQATVTICPAVQVSSRHLDYLHDPGIPNSCGLLIVRNTHSAI